MNLIPGLLGERLHTYVIFLPRSFVAGFGVGLRKPHDAALDQDW
jgi:hypothetical protein